MQLSAQLERGIVLRHFATPADLTGVCLSVFERQDAVALGPSIDFPSVHPILHVSLGHDCSVRNYGQDAPFQRAPHAAIWGSQTAIHEMRFDGPLFLISAVLTLDGTARLTGHLASAFVGRHVTLDDLGLDSGGLRQQLLQATAFPQRADILIGWLRRAIGSRRQRRASPEFDHLASGRMQGSIAAIAADLGVTARGLHKRAMRDVGLSPKTILRYARLQSALRYCHPNQANTIDAGKLLIQFHDRSHFSVEFRKLTGLTPRAYQQAKLRSGDQLLNMVYLDTEIAAGRD